MCAFTDYINDLLKAAIAVYAYGGVVYGTTNTSNSDRDYIVVVDDSVEPPLPLMDKMGWQLRNNGEDFSIYTKSTFQQMLGNNDITALECLFQEKPIKPYAWEGIIIDKGKVRVNISSIASNSWVKCKKKLTVEKDYNVYVGKKSMFHAIRLLMFGIQIGKYGKITNYSEANSYWSDIVLGDLNRWSELKEKYQPIYNNLSTQFKLVCPINKS